MSGRRPRRNRHVARILATGAVVCLVLAMAGPAVPLDPGDGTVIAPQPGRRPLPPPSGKIARLDSGARRGDTMGAGKAELSVYQDFPMEFGALCRKSGSVVLGVDNTIIEDLDVLVYGGTTYSAVIRLEGDPLQNVTIEITAPPAVGFQLGDFTTDRGPVPLFSQTLDGAGQLTLQLGARLTLDAAAIAAGTSQQISYTISTFSE
jgi:hypothetical protein